MDDKKFDEMIKNQVQKDEKMDKRFDDLFETYKEKYKMERGSNMKTNNASFIPKMRYVAAVLVVGILLGTGGMTYAHINGVETWISPLLRRMGINSKYEENATKINDVVIKNTEKVEMLDAAIDDSTLIVGYKISMPKVELENWIEVVGEYKVNDISIKPVSTSIEKEEGEEGTDFIYYQMFDLNEIQFGEIEKLNFKVDILEIAEYVEVEGLMDVSIAYKEKYQNGWDFEKDIAIKNIEENKTYKLNAAEVNYKDVIFDATEIVKSSYTNMIRIKTDKTNYNGDAFEVYYRIYNSEGTEIAAGKENRDYDEVVYNDRLFVGGIEKDSKLKIDIYFFDYVSESYEKVGTINVDMNNAEEVVEAKLEYTKYDGDDYSFEYNKEWILKGILGDGDVGPNSRYMGALALNAPATTNEEYGMSISVIMEKANDLEIYINDLRAGFEMEYFDFVSKEESMIGALNGYKLVMNNGEQVSVTYAIKVDDMIYDLSFSGDEKEINNREAEIKKMVESFEVK